MSSTTFVTSLLECTDNPIQQARITSYLESAEKLLNLDVNLVVYVNHHLYAKLFHIVKRPVFFIPINIEDLPAFRHVPSISIARKVRRYNPDPRNTPQYFAITSSKHWMVRNAININPFSSDKFFWIDLGIHKTCNGIDQATMNSISDWTGSGIRTGMLKSYPINAAYDRDWYYQFGRPGLIGTLWGGHRVSMITLCDLMIEIFEDNVANGYGHADEQLMYEAFERRPDLFNLFPADYSTLTRNFIKVSQMSNVYHCVKSAKESSRTDLFTKLMDECLSSEFLSAEDNNLLRSI